MNQIFHQNSTLNIDLFATREREEVVSDFLPLSGSVSLDSRCSLCDMERNLCACISPTSFYPTRTAEGSDVTMCTGVDCSPLSQRVLVSSLTGVPGGYSNKTKSLRRHVT
jgi:hypothetical protein